MLAKAGLKNPAFFWTYLYSILLYFTLLYFILHNFTLGIARGNQVEISDRFVCRIVPLKPTSTASDGLKPGNDQLFFGG